MMRCLLVGGVIVEGRLEWKLGTRVVMSFCFGRSGLGRGGEGRGLVVRVRVMEGAWGCEGGVVEMG